jgi:hypothetical protein
MDERTESNFTPPPPPPPPSTFLPPRPESIAHDTLCQPCLRAIRDHDLGRIGTQAWVNDGYSGCEALEKPAVYCCLCRHVLRAQELARRRGEPTLVSMDEQIYDDAGIWRTMHFNTLLHDDADIEAEDAELHDFEVEKCTFAESVSPRHADIKCIVRWLNNCESNHNNCKSRGKSPHSSDTNTLLFVDITNECLYQGDFEDRYLALSYVWGCAKQFCTLKQNYEDLLIPGALVSAPLGQTIRDAMTLVKSLGEQYLWVDTLVRYANAFWHKFLITRV